MRASGNSQQRKALLAAVKAWDVATITQLLEAGLGPSVSVRNITAYELALVTGREAVVQPFVDAFLRSRRPMAACELGRIARHLFSHDEFSAAFAGTLVGYVTNGATAERGRRIWDGVLGHPGEQKPWEAVRRQDTVLAEKVALAVADGWRPAEAWQNGWLPHHEYLHLGCIEAAWACVIGGANPDEPMRRFGLEPPETFVHTWPAFHARVVAARRAAAAPQLPFTTTGRVRQRA